jgi:hypothetical protein
VEQVDVAPPHVGDHAVGAVVGGARAADVAGGGHPAGAEDLPADVIAVDGVEAGLGGGGRAVVERTSTTAVSWRPWSLKSG